MMLTSQRFKPPGVQSGVNENTRDGFEALRVIRNHHGEFMTFPD